MARKNSSRTKELAAQPLWSHQKQSKARLKDEPRVMDASDPGTGKTRVALETWAERRNHKNLLVVAPSSLLLPAWGADIDKYLPGAMYSLVTADQREEAFNAKADIYLINTDGVKWLAKQPPKMLRRFDTIVIDEITAFKHRTSDRSKALIKLIERGNIEYREGLSGTVNPNTILDVWHQYYILDDGERLGKKFFQFRSAVCEPKPIPGTKYVRWEDKPYAEEAVAAIVGDITIRHEFDQCMDIPPHTKRFVTYTPNAKLMKLYRELEKRNILELEKGAVSAVHAAALRTKLLQVASGAVYINEDTYEVLDRGRYELLMDLVEPRDHSVLFFNWKHQKIELLREAERRKYPVAVIDGTVPQRERNTIVNDYQAGRYKVLLLHPQTGAHGLTLTKGTRTLWGSPTYQADFLKQGIHRIYRGGQTKRTETIMVEAKGTVERIVFERLGSKSARMNNFLDILKENHK